MEDATKNNIILDDKELEVLMRKLVRSAKKKGHNIEELKEAINVMYNTDKGTDAREKDNVELLEETKKRVSKFIKHYLFDEVIHEYQGSAKIQALFACIVSIYVLFKEGKEVNITEIKEYSLKNHLIVKREGYWISNRTMYSMHSFFYEQLDFGTDEQLPIYEKRNISSKTITSVKEFKEFLELHTDYTQKLKTLVTIAVVWFLDEYF